MRLGTTLVEMGNSASYYYIGKDQAFAFGTAVPFGAQHAADERMAGAYGGGLDLLNELYRPYNVYGIPFGNYDRADGRLVSQGRSRRPMI